MTALFGSPKPFPTIWLQSPTFPVPLRQICPPLAQLPVLAEYLMPLLKVGGKMVALKGESAAREVSAAGEALRLLGGEMRRLIAVELPEVAETHHLVLIEKVAASPAQYPRRAGVPSRRPL